MRKSWKFLFLQVLWIIPVVNNIAVNFWRFFIYLKCHLALKNTKVTFLFSREAFFYGEKGKYNSHRKSLIVLFWMVFVLTATQNHMRVWPQTKFMKIFVTALNFNMWKSCSRCKYPRQIYLFTLSVKRVTFTQRFYKFCFSQPMYYRY